MQESQTQDSTNTNLRNDPTKPQDTESKEDSNAESNDKTLESIVESNIVYGLETTQDSNIESNTQSPPNESTQSIKEELLNEVILQEIIAKKPLKSSKEAAKKPKKRKIKHFKNIEWTYPLYSRRVKIALGAFLSVAAVYAYFLLFGATSLETLLSLRKTREDISKQVELQREENAKLQKKVLELLSLEP